MNPKRKQRLILISAMVIGVGVAVSLILLALVRRAAVHLVEHPLMA